MKIFIMIESSFIEEKLSKLEEIDRERVESYLNFSELEEPIN